WCEYLGACARDPEAPLRRAGAVGLGAPHAAPPARAPAAREAAACRGGLAGRASCYARGKAMPLISSQICSARGARTVAACARAHEKEIPFATELVPTQEAAAGTGRRTRTSTAGRTLHT